MLTMAQLRRQPDSTEKVAEPRIGAKGRKPRICLEIDDGIGSGNVVMQAILLQPVEGSVSITQGCVWLRQCARHVKLFGRSQTLQLFRPLAQHAFTARLLVSVLQTAADPGKSKKSGGLPHF